MTILIPVVAVSPLRQRLIDEMDIRRFGYRHIRMKQNNASAARYCSVMCSVSEKYPRLISRGLRLSTQL